MKLVLGAAVLAAIALAASACGSSHPTSGLPPSGTVSSSRLILGGAVRCTATVTTPVQVGDKLGVSIRFENVSTRTVDVHPGYGGIWVVVTSPDGTSYDTRVPWENASGPPPAPIPLRPGASATRQLRPELRVRWEGPLSVTPGCEMSAAPPVRVAVTSPGPAESATAAVRAVVAAAGHLLDNCRPSEPGIAVVGRIDAPSGDAPPMQARCSVDLRRQSGFYDAQVLVLTPPDLPGVHVQRPYETLSGTSVRNENTQALAWEFVVTGQGATSVDSASYETTRPRDAMTPDWLWGSSGPTKAGDVRCGGSGVTSGNGNGPAVWFVSACGS